MNTHWYRTIVDSPAGRRVVQLLILALIAVGLGVPPTAAWAVGRERAVLSAPLPPGKVGADARTVDPPPTQERAPDDSPLARERAGIEAEVEAARQPPRPAPGPPAAPDATEHAERAEELAAGRKAPAYRIPAAEEVDDTGKRRRAAPGPAAAPLTLEQLAAPPAAAASPPTPEAHPAPQVAAAQTYGASYQVGQLVLAPRYDAIGYLRLTVTNTSNFTWTTTGQSLGLHLYRADQSLLNYTAAFTALPADVAPGTALTFDAVVPFLGPGNYLLVYEMADTGNGGYFFSHYGVPAAQAAALTVPHYAPSASDGWPAVGATVASLTQPLSAFVGDDASTPVQVEYQLCTDSDPAKGTCWGSGWQGVPAHPNSFGVLTNWTPPAGALRWNTAYWWRLRVQDSGYTSPFSGMSPFTVVVPPPNDAARLGLDPGALDETGVNLYLGNYTSQETDADFPQSGIGLQVQRTYNSAGTANGSFGIGWSSLWDMGMKDAGNGLFTLALADGRKVNFGRNTDGALVSEYGGTNVGQWIEQGHLKLAGLDYYLGDKVRMITRDHGSAKVEFERTYDSGGQVSASVLVNASSDRRLYLRWFGGHITTVSTSPSFSGTGALTWTYTYTGDYLTKVCAPGGGCTTYSYEASRPDGGPKRLVKVQQARAENSTTIGYDGALVQHVGRADNSATGVDNGWTYDRSTDTTGPMPVLRVHRTDPRGVHTYYQYNQAGRLEYRWNGTPTPPPGRTRMFLYDAFGRLTAFVDENDNVVRYGWDNVTGALTTTTRYRTPTQPYTERTEYYLDPAWAGDPRNGLPVRSTDANGHTTEQTYNTAGFRRTETDPTGGVTTTVWGCRDVLAQPVVNDIHPGHQGPGMNGACGVPVSVTDAGGRTTRYGYNGENDQTQVTDPAGRVVNTFHDDLGRVTSRTVADPAHPAGVATDYTYDQAGRLATETGPAVTNPVTGVTHRARTGYTYDADGNLATRTVSDLTPAAQGGDAPRTTTFGYDAQDRLTSVAQDGVTTKRVTYDQLGNITDSWSPNGAHYVYGYDVNGRLTTVDLKDFVDDPGTAGPPKRAVRLKTFGYDRAGRLSAAADAMGHLVTYTYTADDLVLTEKYSLTAQDGNSSREITLHTFTYDNAGNVVKDVRGDGPDARTTTYAYDAANRPTRTTADPGGLNRTTTTAYDRAGLVTASTVTDGTRTETRENVWDQATGQLAGTVVRPEAGTALVTGYLRDAHGRVLASTDPRGMPQPGAPGSPDPAYTTTTGYDLLGRPSTVTLPAAQVEDGTPGATPTARQAVTTRGYNTFGELTDLKDSTGRTTRHLYDRQGRRTETRLPAYTPPGATAALNPVEKWTYDADGNTTAHTDALGRTVTYTYDLRDRLVRTTLPPTAPGAAPGVTVVRRDDNGNVLSVIDPTGAQTLAVYDGMDRRISATSVVRNGTATPDTYTTTYTHDDFGDVLTETLGTTTTAYTYDKLGELASSTPAGRGTTRWTYDLAGRPLTTTDPLGRVSTTGYDLAGRPTTKAVADPAGTVLARTGYGYDAAGNTVSVTDPNGQTWRTAYDARNQPTTLTDPPVRPGDAASAPVTGLGHDLLGRLTRITDANGNATHQRYNTLGLAETESLPAVPADQSAADRTTTTAYDAAGQVTGITEPGGVRRTFGYDGLGRLTTETGTGGDGDASRTFGYDLAGRITSASAPGGPQTFTWDDRGLLTGSRGPLGTSAFTYDAAARPLTETDPGGARVSYTWSGNTDLGTVTDSLSGLTRTLTHDLAGQVTTEKRTAGQTAGPTRTLAYDGLGRVTADTVTDPTGHLSTQLTYSWDPAGRLLTSGSTGTADPHGETYDYDPAGRLTRVTDTTRGTGTDYGWDAAGNRTSVTDWTGTAAQHTTTGTSTAAYDPRNRLTSTTAADGSTTGYTFTPRGTLATTTTKNAAGAVTASSTNRYDALGRLTGVDGRSYAYDALDRLTAATAGAAGAASFTYPGLAKEPDSDGSWSYARAFDGTPLAAAPSGGGTARTLLTNAHHDVLGTTDTGSGALAAGRSYSPFGKPTATTGATPGLGFQGGWTDPATGRVHAQARWYDPGTGRFTSGDDRVPGLGSAAATNRYGYGDGDPLGNWDPSGHFSIGSVLGGIGHAIELTEEAFAAMWGEGGAVLRTVGGAVVTAADAAGAAAVEGLAVAGAEVVAVGATAAEAAGAALVCAAGCVAAIVVGTVIVVAVAGYLVYEIVNADGSLSPVSTGTGTGTSPRYDPRDDPRVQRPRASGTTDPAAKSPPRPAGTTITATRTNVPRPQATPPRPVVVKTGTSWRTTEDVRTETSHWWDDTYLYTRTDTWITDTTFITTHYSDGSWTESGPQVSIRHLWETLRKALIDFTNPIQLPVPTDTNSPDPHVDNPADPGRGCGTGGPADDCPTDTAGAGRLPGGALDPTPTPADAGQGGRKPPTADAPSCDADEILPQGVTAEKFAEAAEQLRAHPRGQEGDLVVQGSRAAGTARPDSDIDFAIRVDSDRFDQLIGECFGTPNPGSAKEKTRDRAAQSGKIQAGEAGMKGLRKLLARTLGMKVDLSVIRIGGPFDNPPFIGVP
ncbi:RHS repeat-associated core domain-containing protein [Streptomyces sp. TLI_053]|uniref:RHS repeat-associated core domain-containing protein n=1 Tax=Streptomyces sp. TLI_053 TaxID=1855352 RepID=UPI00087BC352|nr:RHS repeat-associated core domain-containing protein [Streptomyces sp. TLI_053]SDT81909.1 RHS repeat-associated core domain-containing protein [Streptomyces sp. TLI_053]